MKFIQDDGGRSAAGFKGSARDCVCRSIAIVSGLPYKQVYDALAKGAGSERKSKGKSARNGIFTHKKWFKNYMYSLGFTWTPTMKIGQGCKVHLREDELPAGRLVVSVSKHYTAVIDHVVHDTQDPQRLEQFGATESDKADFGSSRCVYGYWTYTEPVSI